MSRNLVIGLGEVGQAILEVLQEGKVDVFGIDRHTEAVGKFDVLHVCFPYISEDQFIPTVKAYEEKYLLEHGLTVIHSTVPLGTTWQIGPHAVHSPVRGVHPNLKEGIKTFPKFVGGPRCMEVGELFRSAGLNVQETTSADTTEALKLWDTTYYGWNIIFEKAVKEYCNRHQLDFELVYNVGNTSYNEGYTKLGMAHVCRPVLRHVRGEIGGHCVLPNARLLQGDIADFLLKANESLKEVE